MTVAELIESIKKLPPEEQTDIEAIVRALIERRFLGQKTATPRFSQELLDRIDARRKRLGQEFGLFDSSHAISEFHEGRI